MLLGENLSRCHQHALAAVGGGNEKRGGGDRGFAGADFTLEKAAHRNSLAKVGGDLSQHALLSVGETVRLGREQGAQAGLRQLQGPAGASLPALAPLKNDQLDE